jgi:hypothetical protein
VEEKSNTVQMRARPDREKKRKTERKNFVERRKRIEERSKNKAGGYNQY